MELIHLIHRILRENQGAFRDDLDCLLLVPLHVSHFINLCEAAFSKKPALDVTTNDHLVVLIVEPLFDDLLLGLVSCAFHHRICRCGYGQTSVWIDVVCPGNSWLNQRCLRHYIAGPNLIVFINLIDYNLKYNESIQLASRE